jgi:hypothetical protein
LGDGKATSPFCPSGPNLCALQQRHLDENPRIDVAEPCAGDTDGSGKDEVLVDFGASGLSVRYNNATWTRLSAAPTQAIVSGGFD